MTNYVVHAPIDASGKYGVPKADTKLVLTDTGRLGIGTTSPDSALSVVGDRGVSNPSQAGVHMGTSGTTAWGTIQINGDTGSQIDFSSPTVDLKGRIEYNNSDNAFKFYTNGSSERMRINSSGNVGIGTTNPTSDFQISTNLYFDKSVVAGGNVGSSDAGPRLLLHGQDPHFKLLNTHTKLHG